MRLREEVERVDVHDGHALQQSGVRESPQEDIVASDCSPCENRVVEAGSLGKGNVEAARASSRTARGNHCGAGREGRARVALAVGLVPRGSCDEIERGRAGGCRRVAAGRAVSSRSTLSCVSRARSLSVLHCVFLQVEKGKKGVSQAPGGCKVVGWPREGGCANVGPDVRSGLAISSDPAARAGRRPRFVLACFGEE